MLKLRPFRLISSIVLVPVFFSAYLFCPFRLPYLYCFICPLRCFWYQFRGIVVLAVLGLNIMKNDFFCNNLCPYGTIQTVLSKMSSKKIALRRSFRSLKYLGLVIIVFIVAVTKNPGLLNNSLMNASLNKIFVIKMRGLLFGTLLLSIVISIFSPKFFCHNLCPVRALGRITRKMLVNKNY